MLSARIWSIYSTLLAGLVEPSGEVVSPEPNQILVPPAAHGGPDSAHAFFSLCFGRGGRRGGRTGFLRAHRWIFEAYRRSDGQNPANLLGGAGAVGMQPGTRAWRTGLDRGR